MGETGQDIAVKPRAEIVQLTEHQRLVNGINTWLNPDEAMEAQYLSDEGSDLTARFIVVESVNGLTKVAIRRTSGVEDGLTDVITLRWLNEKQKRAGFLRYSGHVNGGTLVYDHEEEVVDDSYKDLWKLQGGMSSVPNAKVEPDFSPERIGQLATLLEKGHVSEKMTEAAVSYFETELGGVTLRQSHDTRRSSQPPGRIKAEVVKTLK